VKLKAPLSVNSSFCVAAPTVAKGVITNTRLTTSAGADRIPAIFLLNFPSLLLLLPLFNFLSLYFYYLSFITITSVYSTN
jgi:hypothetical protein